MPTLQTTEIGQALEYFDRTQKRLSDVTKDLSEAQWHFKPAPDRWSVAENLEHLVLVHDRILGPVREQLAQAPAPPAGHDTALIDSIVYERVPDRTNRANAPEFLHPTGRMAPAEALARIPGDYRRLAEILESTPDLREHGLESPPLRFLTNGAHTTMDGFQWVVTVASHDERHIRQILEIQADPNYPRNA